MTSRLSNRRTRPCPPGRRCTTSSPCKRKKRRRRRRAARAPRLSTRSGSTSSPRRSRGPCRRFISPHRSTQPSRRTRRSAGTRSRPSWARRGRGLTPRPTPRSTISDARSCLPRRWTPTTSRRRSRSRSRSRSSSRRRRRRRRTQAARKAWTWRRRRMPTSPTRRDTCWRLRVDGTPAPSSPASSRPLAASFERDSRRSGLGAGATVHLLPTRVWIGRRRGSVPPPPPVPCGRTRTRRPPRISWCATAARLGESAIGSRRGRRGFSPRRRGSRNRPRKRKRVETAAGRGSGGRRDGTRAATTTRATRSATSGTTRRLALRTRLW